jgi:hypothetical protein
MYERTRCQRILRFGGGTWRWEAKTHVLQVLFLGGTLTTISRSGQEWPEMIQRSRVALIAARNFTIERVALVVVYHSLCCGRRMSGDWFITTWDSIGSKKPSRALLYEHLVYEVASIDHEKTTPQG